MIAKRRWRQIAIAIATFALLWFLAELAFGLTRQFLTQGVALQRMILTTTSSQPYFHAMPSTYVRMRGFAFAWPAHAVIAALALAMLWRVRKRPMLELAFPAATATFIVLPYGFNYDMAVVSLGFAALIHQRWFHLADWEKCVAVLGFLSPTFTAYLIDPLILLAGLFLQTRQPVAPPEQRNSVALHPPALGPQIR